MYSFAHYKSKGAALMAAINRWVMVSI